MPSSRILIFNYRNNKEEIIDCKLDPISILVSFHTNDKYIRFLSTTSKYIDIDWKTSKIDQKNEYGMLSNGKTFFSENGKYMLNHPS